MESHRPSIGDVAPAARTSSAAGSIGLGVCLARGMAAGLLAGVLDGLFQLVAGEKAIEQAIRLEHLAAAAAGEHEMAEVFTRGQQRIGMILATALFGVALGGVLGIVYFVMARRMVGSPWERSLKIALAGFASFFLVPFVKYPANPPGVGDPATIGLRTASYLFMAFVSVAGCLVAVAVARRLKARGVEAPRRHLVVGLCYLLVLGTAFVALPGAEDPGSTPAGLLWDFRMASVGGQLILWVVTGAGLGLLMLRAERKAAQVTE